MIFKKIVDLHNIQGYLIKSPTQKIKKVFPKRFIVSVVLNGMHKIENCDSIPFYCCFPGCVGYIFSYMKFSDKFFSKYDNDDSFVEILGNTISGPLEEYFIDYIPDLILNYIPTRDIVPITIRGGIVVKLQTATAMSDLQQILDGAIKEAMVPFQSLEEWIFDMVENCPLNAYEEAISYPKTINEKCLKDKHLNKYSFMVVYDFKPNNTTKIKEEEIIQRIEDLYENPNLKLYIGKTFNDIKKNIEEEMKNKKIPINYSQEGELIISLKDYRKLNTEIPLVDLF